MTITNLLSTILFASLDLLAAIAYMEKEFDTSSSISGVKKRKKLLSKFMWFKGCR